MSEPATPFGWYETSMLPLERKRRGHFSTPSPLIELMLDACGYTTDRDLSRIRVLDPACGSGNFLAATLKRLLAWSEVQEVSERRLRSIVRRNLWGFDPDPISCFLTEMHLLSGWKESHGERFSPILPFHLHQADSLTLSWEPRVDLFLANPPYLASKNSDLSGYRSALQRGQADSYLLFLDLALQAVRPNGWLGLVLPDPLLARANAAPERSRLLRETTIHQLWHLSHVFSAQVGAVVLIAQKKAPSRVHQVNWVHTSWPSMARKRRTDQSIPFQQVDQRLLKQQPGSELRYLLHSQSGTQAERLRRALERPKVRPALVPLSQYLWVHRGEELGRTNALVSQVSTEPEHKYPVLRGGIDLRPYVAAPGSWRLPEQAISKPLDRYLRPKLLVVKSSAQLRAALDLDGQIALQTLYLLTLAREDLEPDFLYFFLALLNSQILRDYTYIMHTAYKMVQPQIEQHVLARLPIPAGLDRPEVREIVDLAQQLCLACRVSGVVEWNLQCQNLAIELERVIRALYASCVPDLFMDKGVSYGSYTPNSRPGREAGTRRA